MTQEHQVKRLCQRVTDMSQDLKSGYADEDETLKEEQQILGQAKHFDVFYKRLHEIRSHHRASKQTEFATPMTVDPTEGPTVEFTDEEGYGRYLDMHALYGKFVNLKNVERVDYLTYLATFDRLFEVSTKDKNAAYKAYLEQLVQYLVDFHSRAEPLYDLPSDLSAVQLDFEKTWEEGSCVGWDKTTAGADDSAGAAAAGAAEPVDVAGFGSAAELEALSLEQLKATLLSLGLKCGGTAAQRAERLFSTKGKARAEWDKKILAGKPKGGKSKKDATAAAHKALALMEMKVYKMAGLLAEIRTGTRENVERKQARTAAEREAENEDVEIAGDDDAGDEDDNAYDSDNELIYNPKDLPLDELGKPIPYWLYKLHGLNVRYVCEICGDASYRGPKAFQRHFNEWRHASGMRRLGIPNTTHFHNVTLIADAQALWKKLQTQKEVVAFKAADEEEYEDSQGNVVNKKTYEDLKRQGLL